MYFEGVTQSKSFLDTSIAFPMFKLGFGLQFPAMDLKDRFGSNSTIEGEFAWKSKSNIVIGLKGNFIFSDNVKENDILSPIKTTAGNLIDIGGEPGVISLDERGFSIFLTAGKLIPVFSPNKNSGILLTAGAGVLQHKIKIDFRDSQIPQLDEEYRKGYDRLSNGFAVQGFIGYLFFSNKRLINFYGGFDYVYASTKNRRGFNFDTMEFDNKTRNDALTGIKIGWILPLYKAKPDEFYYY